jgi:hypothetical protein
MSGRAPDGPALSGTIVGAFCSSVGAMKDLSSFVTFRIQPEKCGLFTRSHEVREEKQMDKQNS